jgi:hypothetical protein
MCLDGLWNLSLYSALSNDLDNLNISVGLAVSSVSALLGPFSDCQLVFFLKIIYLFILMIFAVLSAALGFLGPFLVLCCFSLSFCKAFG